MSILRSGRGRGVVIELLLLILCTTALVARAPATTARKGGIAPYRGLGSWVDIYDTQQFDHPVATVRAMKRRGVRTLFLETGNYSRGPIYRPAAAARFIHAAHARNMRVVPGTSRRSPIPTSTSIARWRRFASGPTAASVSTVSASTSKPRRSMTSRSASAGC